MIEEFENQTVIGEWNQLYGGAVYDYQPPETIKLIMRDGCSLATDIYLPKGAPLPLPCVLVRTPYGKGDDAIEALPFVMHGFAVAIQDTRGRHDSEGAWEPFMYETEDGSDTLDQLAACDWCNGDIGMFGPSYLGFVQWAAAASGNPHLKALVSLVAAGTDVLVAGSYVFSSKNPEQTIHELHALTR